MVKWIMTAQARFRTYTCIVWFVTILVIAFLLGVANGITGDTAVLIAAGIGFGGALVLVVLFNAYTSRFRGDLTDAVMVECLEAKNYRVDPPSTSI